MMITEEVIKRYIPTIIDAYSELLGEKYSGIIAERSNNLQYFIYESVESLQSYYDFLTQQKRKELSLKFLDIIGIKSNEFDEDLNVLINGHLDIWNNLLKNYEDYERTLEPYVKRILEERKLKEEIYEEKSEDFFKKAYNILPLKIRILLDKNNLSIYEFFDSFNILEEKSNIEYFSEEDNIKLLDDNVSENEKENIKYNRQQYLSKLINDRAVEFLSYEDIIKKYNLDGIIPSKEIVQQISQLKKLQIEEAEKDYYNTKYNLEQYPEHIKEILYSNIYNKIISITPISNYSGFFSILFFTYNFNDYGVLDFTILHEFLHQISLMLKNNIFCSGFDMASAIPECCLDVNPYNTDKRKYEILNENIFDILAISALDIIRNKGIYMLEEKNIVKNMNELEYSNTSSVTQDLLKPFVEKYIKQIARVIILGSTDKLFDEIGKENFEDLNDAINKLDYIIDIKKIISIDSVKEEITDDVDIQEFNILLKKIEQIYDNMNNFKGCPKNLHNTSNAINHSNITSSELDIEL